MKFKYGNDGLYAVGESPLIGMSVSKEKMDMIEEILWDGVKSQQEKYDRSVGIKGLPNTDGEASTAKSPEDGKSPVDTYYTPLVNDGFNHLDHDEPAGSCIDDETNEILNNPEVMKSINISIKQFNEGKGIPLSKLDNCCCPDWCEGVDGDVCLDVSWDVGVCDKCIEKRGVECGF